MSPNVSLWRPSPQPQTIRVDNGPEYISGTLPLIETSFRLPGSGTNGVHDLILNNNERHNMGIGGITPAMKLKTAA